MKSKTQSRGTEEGIQPGLKIKKLVLQVSIGDRNLANEVKKAFDLAKSSGLELDLTFSHGAV